MTETDIAPASTEAVSLREVTAATVRAVCNLVVKPEQVRFVASNAVSMAEAHFYPQAWFRAIYAGEAPVGFLMLWDEPEKPEYYLWRFMIADQYQSQGFGREALKLVVEYVRSRPNARELVLSYVLGDGGPRDFYARFGFLETGEMEGAEVLMKLSLSEVGALGGAA